MGYIDKDKIVVFPATQRGNKFLSQEDLLRIYELMYNEKSFIISTQADVMGNNIMDYNGKLEFVIDGYYFKIPNVRSIKSILTCPSYTDLYAFVQKDKNGKINSIDEDGEFKGLNFSIGIVGGKDKFHLGKIIYSVDTFSLTIDQNNACGVIDGGTEE